MKKYGQIIVTVDMVRVIKTDGGVHDIPIPKDYASGIERITKCLLEVGYGKTPVIFVGSDRVRHGLIQQGYQFRYENIDGKLRTIAGEPEDRD